MKAKTAPVTIYLGRFSGTSASGVRDGYTLRLTDERSRTVFFEAVIPSHMLADLLSNREVPIDNAWMLTSDNLGKYFVSRRIDFPRTRNTHLARETWLQEECSRWEEDNPGWKISAYDRKWNGHRLKSTDKGMIYSLQAHAYFDTRAEAELHDYVDPELK